ncbi:putative methyltransferase PMT3 [Hibiscus syriacus]|uniref:Methyltransferase n=1 Tax=Hibiscus syriacus TaxID=106335 RepID=A0A6A3C4F8_HIBSY|nr:putative methyltransferase PMT3 [Hibiscus syriacus]
MRGRSDGGQKKRLITYVVVAAIFLGFLYVYYGSIFGSSSNGASALEYGSKSLRKFGSSYLGGDDEADGKQYESSTKVGLEDGEEDSRTTNAMPPSRKKIQLLDSSSSRIQGADEVYIVNLSYVAMDIPIKWPQSRDEVWKANIPHTNLAHEKSDQNWMVVQGEKGRINDFGSMVLNWQMLNFSHNNFNNEGRLRTVLDVGYRLLRPGGYFAYSSPEAYAQDEEDLRIWTEMSVLVEQPGTNPPLCRSDNDPDAVWGVRMEACITPYLIVNDQKAKGSGLAPWPARLTSPPPRLADFGYSNEMFVKDTETWHRRVESYWNLSSPKIEDDTLRNLMDMKAHMGSFAAALKDKNVWVMNVIPEDGRNTLKLIYDRGLIGTTHDWCEAFSTYPRTYDLLHAWTVFSDIEKKGCSAEDLLLEMDPVATADSSSDSEHEGDEAVFIVQRNCGSRVKASGTPGRIFSLTISMFSLHLYLLQFQRY